LFSLLQTQLRVFFGRLSKLLGRLQG
jgi:hypothetical protein